MPAATDTMRPAPAGNATAAGSAHTASSCTSGWSVPQGRHITSAASNAVHTSDQYTIVFWLCTSITPALPPPPCLLPPMLGVTGSAECLLMMQQCEY